LALGIFLIPAAFAFALPTAGRCLTEGLRVRSEPSLKGALVDKLALDEEVLVLGTAGKPETIDGLRADWLALVDMAGRSGWAFGGYLACDTERAAEGGPSSPGDVDVQTEDYAGRFPGGRLTVAWVRCSALRLVAGFAALANGRPQLVFYEREGVGYEDTTSIAAVETADVVGDFRREIFVDVEIDSYMGLSCRRQVYGLRTADGRYGEIGSFPCSAGSDPAEPSGYSQYLVDQRVEADPGGARRLVLEYRRTEWRTAADEAGEGAGRVETAAKVTATYGFDGDALYLAGETESALDADAGGPR
jgi:hypothetical protein